MPVTSFVPAVVFEWSKPDPQPEPAPAPEVRAPALPTVADLVAAARRLLKAFRLVEKKNPTTWRMDIHAPRSGYGGQEPQQRFGCWWLLGSREVHEEPRLFFCALPSEVAGLARLCRELYRCRRLAKRSDPTDAKCAVFGQLVWRILAERWARGPFLSAGNNLHSIAVTYPTELLAILAEWVEAAPRKPGPKPDPVRAEIVARLVELRAARMVWKDITRTINAEFTRSYTRASLQDLYKMRAAICGVK